ncbi:MAG: lytic transglycosylase domain-containing protein [Sphingomicrobium sp.]
MRPLAVFLVALAVASPALAQQQDDPLAPLDSQVPKDLQQPPPSQPTQPTPQDQAGSSHPYVAPRVAPKDWRGVFAAIRGGDWLGAQLGIAALPDDPVKAVAKAELYTARNSPRVELGPILSLLAQAPDLPHAEQLQRMAIARGAIDPPSIRSGQATVFLGSAPRRQRAKGITGEPLADALRAQLDPLVKADDAAGAEALLLAQEAMLSSEARAEAAQRVAWIHYVLGRDADARRVADRGRIGAGGEWGGQAAWISALAAWRMGDCTASGAAFRDTARLTQDRELAAAGLYWAARSAQACRRPREVEPLLRQAAARGPDSFYALVSRETLGMTTAMEPPRRISGLRVLPANITRAKALAAMGERGLADELLRYQARLGGPGDQRLLLDTAADLNLPGTEYWLAHNGPPGTVVAATARFPLLRWTPTGGWRIDPALAAAHARQESDFRIAVVSPAGATGLMQVRPGTAGDTARARGVALGDLKEPATNLEYGQSFIELMRGKPATQGQLLKVIAAYNAGPLPVDRWNSLNHKGDPILWIESLPYWETRYYVPSVLRNMWVYQGLDRRPQPALKALAEHRWPSFPTR